MQSDICLDTAGRQRPDARARGRQGHHRTQGTIGRTFNVRDNRKNSWFACLCKEQNGRDTAAFVNRQRGHGGLGSLTSDAVLG